MFLRNAWYVAALGTELTGPPVARTFLNEAVVLFRDAQGRAAALEDRCCHRAAPLSMGEVTPKGLMCGYHGLVFDGHGTCVDIPGQTQIPPAARVRAYPVAERDGFVWIWMGDPARASEDTIVRFQHGQDSTTWPFAQGMISVKANYVLVLDNLMDLTHLSYLHRHSIGGAPEDDRQAQVTSTRTPTGSKYLRLTERAAAPKTFGQKYGLTGYVDRWQELEFVAPAIVLQSSGADESGKGIIDKGVREGPHQGRVLHAPTPETEASTHYFFMTARRNGGISSQNDLLADTYKIFAEDISMIEKQQERLTGFDMDRLIDIRSDVARIHMVRALKQMIADENAKDAAE